jgi:undecaprenyl-diphosphatase
MLRVRTRELLWRYAGAIKTQLHRAELPVMLLIAAAAGGIWAFVELADVVLEGESHEIDMAVIKAMRNPADLSDPLGPRWLEEFGRDVTALGGVGVLAMLTLAVVGYLHLLGKRRVAVFLVVAVCGGLLISTLFKSAFDRPRPDLVPHHTYVYTASFPSGHSMLAAVTYFTLGALLARVHRQRRVKIYILSVAAILTFSVGVSRIYMGVHWPTDVLAGWAAGATWAIMCWLLALWLQQQDVIEPEGSGVTDSPRSNSSN